MSLALRRPTMTLADFLDWEARQEGKWEFDGTAPVAMAGGSVAHAAIGRNLAISVGGRLRARGGPCDFFGSDLKLVLAETSRYPDGMVVCAPLDARASSASEPTVVFEVLSPSTAETDRVAKAREYRDTPSVRRYVMLEQGRAAATVYARDADDPARWSVTLLFEGDALALPEAGIEVPMAELYLGLDFGAPAAADATAATAEAV